MQSGPHFGSPVIDQCTYDVWRCTAAYLIIIPSSELLLTPVTMFNILNDLPGRASETARPTHDGPRYQASDDFGPFPAHFLAS